MTKRKDRNHVGMRFTKKTGLSTTPGDTYEGGLCKCGCSAMAHHAQGHFTAGSWQCWAGKWVKTSRKPYKVLLTALPCDWHEFVPANK